jgi:hypothetical protein
MRLKACGCRAEHYQRGPRAWWMKVVWTRRLYHCYACDAFLLLPPDAVRRKQEDDHRPTVPVIYRRT